MQVLFKAHDPEAVGLRSLARRRVRFMMRRLGWLVSHATVQMSDINGPRGGVDKRCQVAVLPVGMPSIVITSIARDWRTALDEALQRAARALLRQWRRQHHIDRSSPRPLPTPR